MPKTPNDRNSWEALMACIMQPSFKFWSATHYIWQLILALKGYVYFLCWIVIFF
jgi:hypothetical protein